MSTTLTIGTVQAAFPRALRSSVTQEFVNKLNQMHTDPLIKDSMQENALGYINILQEGRFKVDDYLSAVKYVTYKMSNCTNETAYAKTFPTRYNKFLLDGSDSKTISAYVSMYNKGKLVTLLLERAMIPVWLVNADNLQKAINTQVRLMTTANSEMVQMQAANSIMTHLKQPEVTKSEITVKDETATSLLDELRQVTQELSKQQREKIVSGTSSAREIAHSTVIKPEDIT
jgi:hypothetical protein